RWQTLIKLRVPAALPSLFAGLKVSSSFAVVGAVVAEFVSASRGIGYVIKSSSYYLNTDLTFAAIIVAAFAGLVFFRAVGVAERRVVFWQARSRDGDEVQAPVRDWRSERATRLLELHRAHRGPYEVDFYGLRLEIL